MIVIRSWGIEETSFRITSTFFRFSRVSVTSLEKAVRSTARESPAGTLVSFATFKIKDPNCAHLFFQNP